MSTVKEILTDILFWIVVVSTALSFIAWIFAPTGDATRDSEVRHKIVRAWDVFMQASQTLKSFSAIDLTHRLMVAVLGEESRLWFPRIRQIIPIAIIVLGFFPAQLRVLHEKASPIEQELDAQYLQCLREPLESCVSVCEEERSFRQCLHDCESGPGSRDCYPTCREREAFTRCLQDCRQRVCEEQATYTLAQNREYDSIATAELSWLILAPFLLFIWAYVHRVSMGLTKKSYGLALKKHRRSPILLNFTAVIAILYIVPVGIIHFIGDSEGAAFDLFGMLLQLTPGFPLLHAISAFPECRTCALLMFPAGALAILPFIVTAFVDILAVLGSTILAAIGRLLTYLDSPRWIKVRNCAWFVATAGGLLLTLLLYKPKVLSLWFQ